MLLVRECAVRGDALDAEGTKSTTADSLVVSISVSEVPVCVFVSCVSTVCRPAGGDVASVTELIDWCTWRDGTGTNGELSARRFRWCRLFCVVIVGSCAVW